MSIERALQFLRQAEAELTTAPAIPASPGQPLQPVIDAAAPGSTVALAAGTYPGSLVLTKPVTLIGPTVGAPGQRVVPATMGTWIVGSLGADAVTVTGDDVSLIGIGLNSLDASKQLVAVTGARFAFVGSVGMGSVANGQHRGLMLHGDMARIVDSVIDQCWLPGREAQAIASWDGGKNLTITNCYLGGASQSVLFGGADSTSAARIPTGITITGCMLSKDPTWLAKGALIKTALECKSVDSLHVSDCVLEWAGTNAGQGAYPIVLTVRNQDGVAPWSNVSNVLIENCTARYGGGGVNILGTDNVHPSGRMTNVTLRNVHWTDLNPSGPTGGSGRCIQIDGGPDLLTLQDLTFDGLNMAASGYLMHAGGYPTHLTMRNLKFPSTVYGLKLDAGGSGVPAWQAVMPDAVFALTATDIGASR